jgi:hypothetical protein
MRTRRTNQTFLHDGTAPPQSLDNSRKELFNNFLNFIVAPLLLLLLLVSMLLLLSGITTVLLPTVLLPTTMLPTPVLPITVRRGRDAVNRRAGQINIHSSFVGLGLVIQSHLLTNLFNPRFDLLNVLWTVVALTHDNMEMGLSLRLRSAYPCLQNLLCLFNELAVKIYGVSGHAVGGVVLAEYELRGLAVVLIHLCSVLLPFLAQFMGAPPITALVCLL